MARSLKKGPFADASLLKKVDALNASGQTFDVFADHLVDLLERSAFVPGVEVGFGVVHIGYAQAVPCCCRVVAVSYTHL